ncbi:hypothetical protein Smed_6497 (plasmid) [Sinorhizobium medicae WSM419]|uniref:Uncharacterized protein n=1 Tax=Sinorhizobium medicae (strain WSM419) TaxID=366394 RepID=A6UN20_SINMW|nr:hypothetical protein Smed_6497 [Sinorhizobium medicae WSM419]
MFECGDIVVGQQGGELVAPVERRRARLAVRHGGGPLGCLSPPLYDYRPWCVAFGALGEVTENPYIPEKGVLK